VSHRIVELLPLNDTPPPPLPGSGPWNTGPRWLRRMGEWGFAGVVYGYITAQVAAWYETERFGFAAAAGAAGTAVALVGAALFFVWLALILAFAMRRRSDGQRRGFEVIVRDPGKP
jgi:hypothetical protein